MILIDSNILFDLLSEDPTWFRWSANALAAAAAESQLAINPVIYAETSVRFKTPGEFDEYFPPDEFRREPLPYAAAFLAAKAHLAYRRSGGVRTSTLRKPRLFITTPRGYKNSPVTATPLALIKSPFRGSKATLGASKVPHSS